VSILLYIFYSADLFTQSSVPDCGKGGLQGYKFETAHFQGTKSGVNTEVVLNFAFVIGQSTTWQSSTL
jgi:hypothetical protein